MFKTIFTLISLLGFATGAFAAPTSTMIDACVDKQQGDVCEYTDEKDNQFNGKCQLNSADNTLYCQAYN